jgi:CheY-like chemotaxis protein
MAIALICSRAPLDQELAGTVLWRKDIERHVATRLEEGRMMALAAKPDIVIVDRDLPKADELVAAIRREPATRRVSVVVVARGDFDPSEVALLEAGANGVLRLPPGPDWDDRLVRLMDIPVRKDTRFHVRFQVRATPELTGESLDAVAVNLSLNGMLIESPVALRVGDELGLAFTLPGATADPIEGTGRVVRQAGARQYGVEFHELHGDGRERVRQFVEALTTA